MRKLYLFILGAMLTMSSCTTPAYIAYDEPQETTVEVVTTYSGVTPYSFYFAYVNGRYLRYPCKVYYSPVPYYWGGPRHYVYRNWKPVPPKRTVQRRYTKPAKPAKPQTPNKRPTNNRGRR